MALDTAGLDLLFREARSHNRFTDQPVTDDELRALFKHPEDGSDLGQLLAGALPVPAHEGGEAEAGACAVEWQSGEDDGRAGHGDRGL